MKNNLRKPCNECPFRRVHPNGWLGPWQAEEIPTHLSFGGTFPCHQTIPSDGLGEDSPKAHKMELCAGASIFLNNKVERHRDPEVRAHQELVGEDKEAVFSWTSEFVEHHNSDMKPRKRA